MCRYASLAISGSTRRTYSAGERRYLGFFAVCEWDPLPASGFMLSAFAAHIAGREKPGTVRVNLAAVRNLHLDLGLPDTTVDAALLPRVTKGSSRAGLPGSVVHGCQSPPWPFASWFMCCWGRTSQSLTVSCCTLPCSWRSTFACDAGSLPRLSTVITRWDAIAAENDQDRPVWKGHDHRSWALQATHVYDIGYQDIPHHDERGFARPPLPIQGWSPAIQEDFRGRGPASPGVCIDWQRIELQWPLISNRRSNLGGDGRCPRLADPRNGTMEKRLCTTLHSPRLLSHEGPGQTANFFVQRLTNTCTYCCIHSLPNK